MPLFDTPGTSPGVTDEDLLGHEEQGTEQEEEEREGQDPGSQAGSEEEEAGEEETGEDNPEEEGGSEEEEENPSEEDGTLILGKYKNNKDLSKAYANLMKQMDPETLDKIEFTGDLATDYKRLEREFHNQRRGQQPQGNQGQQPGPGQQGYSKEQVQAINQRLMDGLQNNPLGTLQEVFQYFAEQNIMPQIQPLVQDKEWSQRVQQFAEEVDEQGNFLRPDFNQVAPQMKQVFQQYPGLDQMDNGLEIAYNLAKSQYAAQSAQEARKQGLDEGYKNAAKKKGAKMPGSKSKSNKTEKTPEQQIADEIASVKTGGLFG